MKATIISFFAAFAVSLAVHAQQITVVTQYGITSLFTDLNLAIQSAQAGSAIYLSGGGFQVNDTTKITKKLTIIGIGHRPDNDNADGNTNVSGNFFFNGGSDGSAVMGLWLSGNVNVGTADAAVNNFLLRYCNVNSVQVGNSNCQGVLVNQNYLRNMSSGGNSPVLFSNNILFSIYYLNGGVINHNVIRERIGDSTSGWGKSAQGEVINCEIKNNICFYTDYWWTTNCTFDSNMALPGVGGVGDNSIAVGNDWENVFEGNYSGVNPNDNYALKAGAPGKNAATDGTDVGIYGGAGFSDTALPPGPRIVSKKIAEQTDANGNLPVEITVSVQQ